MLDNIKSNYILKIIIKNHTLKSKYFKLAKKNKKLQQRLEINLDDYKEYYIRLFNQIEIELIPITKLLPDKNNNFIKIRENIKYFHIYFDNDKITEIKRNYLTNKDKVKKITIKIDMELKSLARLFNECIVLKEVVFTKFNREDITDMTELFYGCENLEKLDIRKFKTPNLTKMNWMFASCYSLRELDIYNFDTSKVTEMSCIFSGCISLKKLRFNFDTKNVTNMRNMFFKCMSLKEIDVSNFDTKKVTNFSDMFYNCSSLRSLDIQNFNLYSKNIKIYRMFGGCNNTLKEDIRNQFSFLEEKGIFQN